MEQFSKKISKEEEIVLFYLSLLCFNITLILLFEVVCVHYMRRYLSALLRLHLFLDFQAGYAS